MTKDEEAEFYKEQFLKQIEYNQFLSKQLSDLHLFVMSEAFYNSGGTMTLWFNPRDIDDIIYRKKDK